jgi:anthranilate phosphoribosyltransferase
VARAILAGQPGPVRDTVLLNAAAALAAGAGVTDPGHLTGALADGYARAAAAVDSGQAIALLDTWVAASQRLAAQPR